MRTRKPLGFTLIELMITVVIVAILASIAIPSYSSYVLKSHRTEAKTALLNLASLEERYLNTTNAGVAGVYSSRPSDLGYTANASDLVALPVKVGNGYYQVSMPAEPTASSPPTAAVLAGAAAAFTLTAVPVPGTPQVNDTACVSFTVTSTGVRTALNSAGADNTATCW